MGSARLTFHIDKLTYEESPLIFFRATSQQRKRGCNAYDALLNSR